MKYSYITRIAFVSVDRRATTGWRGVRGKTIAPKEGIKKKKGRIQDVKGELAPCPNAC